MSAASHRLRRASRLSCLTVVLLASAANSSHAGEFGAEATVLEREAVWRTHTLAPRCSYPPAPVDNDLGELLRWDLGRAEQQCEPAATHRELEGYRVTYSWDGRRFTQFLRDDPGATLQVRIHVD